MLNISEAFVLKRIIDEGGMEEILKAAELIENYITAVHSYPAKNKRLKEWNDSDPLIFELIIAIFTITLMNESVTYQTMIGRFNHLIEIEDNIDKFKILADIVGLISLTGLININKPGHGQYINISTDYEILNISEKEKHIVVINKPQPIESNWDPEHKSMLLGHPMNHHENEICLNHLDKLNAIPLRLNQAFINQYTEKPKEEPLTQETKDQWRQFMGESMYKYKELLAHGKKFYLIHKYDTRGRTYTCGYHVTTQGNGFKKAIIELAREELVK